MTKTLYQRPLKVLSPLLDDMLSRLNSPDHLVYLNNDGQPFIACCAREYFIVQAEQVRGFQRIGIDQYHPHNMKFDIHFLHDQHTMTTDTNRFSARPVGLTGYDYAAQQPLPHPHNMKFDINFLHDQHTMTNETNSFSGGYVGFIGYDYAAQQQVDYPNKSQPALFLGQFNSYIKPIAGDWIFYSDDPQADEMFNYIQRLLIQPSRLPELQLKNLCQPRWNKSTYDQAFQKIQDYIVAGDCYQINLTQEFVAQAEGSLLATASKFWQLTDAPYSGYLKINDFELLSCSPELFIDFEANHKIITKPIKGTMPRYSDPVQDEQSKQRLQSSKKDMAENVMIVDLLRNDLSVYAETGSVKTPKLFNIESFNQVHHMVSEVEAKLKPEVNPFEVLDRKSCRE